MSYSESGVEILFFSTDRDELETFNQEFRERLRKKGGEYDGPISLKQVPPSLLDRFLLHIDAPDSEETAHKNEFPDWLFTALDSEEHLETLVLASKKEAGLYGRFYRVMGDRAVSSLLSFDFPDSISIVALSIKKTHHSGSKNNPYSWDPNVDHIPSHPDGPW